MTVMNLDSTKIELIILTLNINGAATMHKVKSILNDVLGKKTSCTSNIYSYFGS